ncbi:MAG: methyltransferase domain-containing protein, partial [Flavobacterium sp.]
MSDSLAPVIFFAYNRPEHTLKALESLMANKLADQSHLFIYCDGAKPDASETALAGLSEVRKIIRSKKWCGQVDIVERKENLGLAKSIIEGVTTQSGDFGKVIVLEDDLVLSPGFLTFMNDALNLYESEEKVMHVSAYVYPVKKNLPETFFYPAATCWGWGTWNRAWKKFNHDPADLVKKLSSQVKEFNLDNAFPFYQILQDNVKNENDSWATRWYGSIFLEKGLSLHPHKSLVQNIGNDGTGIHPHRTPKYDHDKIASSIHVEKISISENADAKQKIIDYFKTPQKNRAYYMHVLKKPARTLLNQFRKKMEKKDPFNWSNLRNTEPVSRKFGFDRGKPIDRYYIEDFLKKNSKFIHGNVLEVAESVYTNLFGNDVSRADLVSADKNRPANAVITDLTDLKSIPDSAYDCFICTQTFNFIYDFEKAIEGSHQLLKKDGVLLATVAGICQISRYDADRWGDFWRFTQMSVQKSFANVFGEQNISVDFYG